MSKSLEKLAVQQFQLTVEIKRLRSLSGSHLEKCMDSPCDGPLLSVVRNKICHCHVEAARDDFDALKPKSYEDEYYPFEELLREYCCEHCNEWHRIQRKEILPLKLKLRSVRAAITKAGKKLATT
ncbi:hypothetical protein [Citrobacter werkmanii]|uniref:hypothetical protein n=1 Tax=Citrobacter werkmanii TaxID=67827 RepID=UPI00388E9121